MLPWLSEGRQTLHHQPSGIVGVFNSQLLLVGTLWEELREVDGLHTCLMLGEGHRLGNIFAIGQDG